MRGESKPQGYPVPGEVLTVKIEVLNGTEVNGLARAVTRQLRRHGVDVVNFGTAAEQNHDSTLIVVRRGDSAAVFPVREILGKGRIVFEADPRLLLDASVILGRDLATALDFNP